MLFLYVCRKQKVVLGILIGKIYIKVAFLDQMLFPRLISSLTMIILILGIEVLRWNSNSFFLVYCIRQRGGILKLIIIIHGG